MQAFHEVFQHTPILSSTCRCTLLLWERWHVYAAHKFRLTTSHSRLVIENSFAAGVWQLWVNLVLFYLLKSESRIWSTLVFTILPIRWVNSASKFLTQFISCCHSVSHISSYSELKDEVFWIFLNWNDEFYTGLSSVDGCITSILRGWSLWVVMISPEEHVTEKCQGYT